MTKPFAASGSYFEIERALIDGGAHATCGGRALNDDMIDTMLTLLINAGSGPVVRDGVDQVFEARVGNVSLPGDAEPVPACAAGAPLA